MSQQNHRQMGVHFLCVLRQRIHVLYHKVNALRLAKIPIQRWIAYGLAMAGVIVCTYRVAPLRHIVGEFFIPFPVFRHAVCDLNNSSGL